MAYENYQPMVEITRGPIVESVQFGAAAVVDVDGNLIASYGDPYTVTFLRSSAKPFQALHFVELKGPEKYHLTDEEISVMCASHSGTDHHFDVVSSIQRKVGIKEENLMCGVHWPMDSETADALRARGEQPTTNRHNCSGKHSGMLAQAVLRGLPIEDYLNNDHEVQKANLQTFSDMTGMPVDQIHLGLDGCSAPVYAVPLYNGALGYARLSDPKDLSPERAAGCRRIVKAMTTFPFMVAGPRRFDTKLMEVGKGKIVTKAGAEGYQGVGLLPGALGAGSPGIGITLKISDGDLTGRADSTIIIEILKQLGALNADQIEELKDFYIRPVYNWRKLVAGEIRPCFTLKRM